VTVFAQAPAKRSEDRSSQRRLAVLLVAPAVILMVAVTAYPIGYAVWLSLQRYNLAQPGDTAFVGLDNYITVLSDGYWWSALAVTLAITVVSVAIELVLGLALALVNGMRCASPTMKQHILKCEALHGARNTQFRNQAQ